MLVQLKLSKYRLLNVNSKVQDFKKATVYVWEYMDGVCVVVLGVIMWWPEQWDQRIQS